MFIATFFASWFLKTNAINIGFLTQTGALSGAVGSRLDFVNSDRVTQIVASRKSTSLFLGVQQYFDYAIKIYVFISVLFLNKLLKRMEDNKKIEYTNFFAFILFFFSFAFMKLQLLEMVCASTSLGFIRPTSTLLHLLRL